MNWSARILPQARKDLEDIAVYIAEENLQAAMRFLDSAETTINKLADYPHRGKLFQTDNKKLSDIRWVPVAGFPFHLIFYQTTQAQIIVIRVIHGGRDLPTILDDDL